jgi:excisionase family DNA binding protein
MPDSLIIEETAEALLTVQEVARLLNVKASWVLDRWQAGELPGFRLGLQRGPVRFRQSEIVKWLEYRRRGPVPVMQVTTREEAHHATR